LESVDSNTTGGAWNRETKAGVTVRNRKAVNGAGEGGFGAV